MIILTYLSLLCNLIVYTHSCILGVSLWKCESTDFVFSMVCIVFYLCGTVGRKILPAFEKPAFQNLGFETI